MMMNSGLAYRTNLIRQSQTFQKASRTQRAAWNELINSAKVVSEYFLRVVTDRQNRLK